MSRRDVLASGDRLWSEAGRATLAEHAAQVRDCGKLIDDKVTVDAVHDMRTATRRLRTAITLFAADADKQERKAIERAVRRVARRLGDVRDLDVLLKALGEGNKDLDPLRTAWESERNDTAKRLKAEIDRPPLARALDSAEQLAPAKDGKGDDGAAGGVVHRIADRAPSLIWAAYGEVLAHELDPLTADPDVVHALRIDAKLFRYTLEAFEAALEPGRTMIEQVTALQDAGGEMHDAIVGRDKARATGDELQLSRAEAKAIDGFAEAQDQRAERLRPDVASRMSAVRSRSFREALARATAGMGHIA